MLAIEGYATHLTKLGLLLPSIHDDGRIVHHR